MKIAMPVAKSIPPTTATPMPLRAAAPAPVAAPVIEEGISPEIVAIISAAIAAYDGRSDKSLVVRSIRRKSGWNRAAREDSICRF